MFICFFNLFLSESSVPAEVVAAVDVNTTANEIYKHNFPTTPLLPKTIEVSLCPLESYLVMQMIRHILFGRIHINTKWLPEEILNVFPSSNLLFMPVNTEKQNA